MTQRDYVGVADFDPNSQPGCWGSYDGVRWRVFNNLQGALSSMNSHRGVRPESSNVRLFEFDEGQWVERVRRIYTEKGRTCDVCGGSTLQQDPWGRPRDYGVWVFKRKQRRLVKPLVSLFVCRACEAHV